MQQIAAFCRQHENLPLSCSQVNMAGSSPGNLEDLRPDVCFWERPRQRRPKRTQTPCDQHGGNTWQHRLLAKVRDDVATPTLALALTGELAPRRRVLPLLSSICIHVCVAAAVPGELLFDLSCDSAAPPAPSLLSAPANGDHPAPPREASTSVLDNMLDLLFKHLYKG